MVDRVCRHNAVNVPNGCVGAVEKATGLRPADFRVLQLQGIAPVLSGIRAALAGAIVTSGLDLARIPCFMSLEDALAHDQPRPR